MCSEAVSYGLNPRYLLDLSCLLCVKRWFESAVALTSPGEQWLLRNVHAFVHLGLLSNISLHQNGLAFSPASERFGFILDAFFSPFMAHCIYNFASFGHISGFRHGTCTMFPSFAIAEANLNIDQPTGPYAHPHLSKSSPTPPDCY